MAKQLIVWGVYKKLVYGSILARAGCSCDIALFTQKTATSAGSERTCGWIVRKDRLTAMAVKVTGRVEVKKMRFLTFERIRLASV